MIISYPIIIRDDAGNLVSGATVTVASVTDKAGTAITSPGATVNVAGSNVTVDYDAEVKGEAWITLAVSKNGSTITGENASPALFAARDSSRIQTGILDKVPGTIGGVATLDSNLRVPANVQVIATDAITGASIATDALSASKFSGTAIAKIQAGLSTLTGPDVASAVWSATTRTLTGFGSLASDVASAVWGAATRTLTSSGSGGATAAEVWAYATRSLTDKSGFALTIQQTQDAATSALNAYDPPTRAEATQDKQELATGIGNVPATVWGYSPRSLTVSSGGSGATAEEVRAIIERNGGMLAGVLTGLANLPTPLNSAQTAAALADALNTFGALNEADKQEVLTAIADIDTGDGSGGGGGGTGDLANMPIEDNLVFVQAMRLIVSFAVGNTTGANTSTPAFRDYNNTKDRIKVSVDGDGRTNVLDAD